MEQIDELRQKIKQLQQQNEALKASIAEEVKKQVKAEFAAIEHTDKSKCEVRHGKYRL